MKISYRADSVELEGYVVVTGRDSSAIMDRTTNALYFEQILPGVFGRELQAKEIPVYLDHSPARKLGTSRTNFEFEEDQIGVRVHAVILDPEIIRKAKEGKLRGWSFAFAGFKYEEEALHPDKKRREQIGDVRIRRKIWDFNLEEISLIDDRKDPVYKGTSVIVIDADLEGKAKPAVTADAAEARIAALEIGSMKARIDNLERKGRF